MDFKPELDKATCSCFDHWSCLQPWQLLQHLWLLIPICSLTLSFLYKKIFHIISFRILITCNITCTLWKYIHYTGNNALHYVVTILLYMFPLFECMAFLAAQRGYISCLPWHASKWRAKIQSQAQMTSEAHALHCALLLPRFKMYLLSHSFYPRLYCKFYKYVGVTMYVRA